MPNRRVAKPSVSFDPGYDPREDEHIPSPLIEHFDHLTELVGQCDLVADPAQTRIKLREARDAASKGQYPLATHLLTEARKMVLRRAIGGLHQQFSDVPNGTAEQLVDQAEAELRGNAPGYAERDVLMALDLCTSVTHQTSAA